MDFPCIRQGDVWLRPIANLPKGLKPKEDRIVALGEATGHHHIVLDGEVFIDEEGKMYVSGGGTATIEHLDSAKKKAEHDPHVLEAPYYEVSIEEEYTPEGMQRVYD